MCVSTRLLSTMNRRLQLVRNPDQRIKNFSGILKLFETRVFLKALMNRFDIQILTVSYFVTNNSLTDEGGGGLCKVSCLFSSRFDFHPSSYLILILTKSQTKACICLKKQN